MSRRIIDSIRCKNKAKGFGNQKLKTTPTKWDKEAINSLDWDYWYYKSFSS